MKKNNPQKIDFEKMETYKPSKIEPRWQKHWRENGTYKNYDRKDKFYALDMFPYPSGEGLHVGHPKGYIATDVVSRFKMLQGYSVLHPMGWDAFGLPAENYAIKNKVHPKEAVEKNIATFKGQLEKFGFTYDWDREIKTTDPEYYKWTQWIFLKMYEKGLAYESNEPINWCPSCKTGLALEDLENGLCERCGTQVVKKKIKQWVLKMTDYADRLLYDLDREDLDWEESIKEQQRNWIGRSEGTIIKFKIQNSNLEDNYIEVFTTRVDTIFGCTYCVLAPEHEILNKVQNGKIEIENKDEVEDYIIKAQNKTDLERTELQKEKTGVELKGLKAVNPFNGEEVPIYVADYVLGGYGTGAVMAVPAHDERDFEFAKKYNLPIKQSIAPLFEATGKDKVRKDKPNTERNTVDVIIKHWEKDEYFCLEWKFNNWKTFVIGGVKEGETLEEAAIREAQEESGYKNMKVLRKIGWEMHSHFFAAHKDINRYPVRRNCVVLELIDDEFEEPEERHVENHSGVWVKKEKVANFLTIPEPGVYWDVYLNGEKAFTEDGILINSGEFTGLSSEEAREKMADWLEKEKIGNKKVNYKMRDWVFSRQRYWGEPIPIVHCEKCGAVPVPEKDLPVELPEVESYQPTDTGESPLANISEWVNTKCPKCGGGAKRETNTMPQWAGSSWYYLRYIDSKNKEELVDKSKEKEWMPVDLYVGGAEHATRHLLYARFWHKFLFDIGVVSTQEPFKKLVYVGLINAEDGRKMSKRWGNVINPDDVISEFGADAMRLYEMFMGPFTQNVSWSTDGVTGVRRFLDKTWKLNEKCKIKNAKTQSKIQNLLQKTIKKVTEDIGNFRFNTAISAMMVLVNEMEKEDELQITDYKLLITILSPFAPHIAEELWHQLGNKNSIFEEKWPEYDESLIKDEEIEMPIQVNGKVRDKIMVSPDISEDEAKEKALASEKVQKYLQGNEPKKVIFIQGRLINIVA